MYFDSFVISMLLAMAVTAAPMVWTLFQFLKDDLEAKSNQTSEDEPPKDQGT